MCNSNALWFPWNVHPIKLGQILIPRSQKLSDQRKLSRNLNLHQSLHTLLIALHHRAAGPEHMTHRHKTDQENIRQTTALHINAHTLKGTYSLHMFCIIFGLSRQYFFNSFQENVFCIDHYNSWALSKLGDVMNLRNILHNSKLRNMPAVRSSGHSFNKVHKVLWWKHSSLKQWRATYIISLSPYSLSTAPFKTQFTAD